MKRSDLDTRTILEAVRQGAPYGQLAAHYPSKVVTAALERELRAGHIDYGVSIANPWLTYQGAAWLTEVTYDDLNIISRPQTSSASSPTSLLNGSETTTPRRAPHEHPATR